jgi:hypothetical protein
LAVVHGFACFLLHDDYSSFIRLYLCDENMADVNGDKSSHGYGSYS